MDLPPPALCALHGAGVQLPVHRRLDGANGVGPAAWAAFLQLLKSPASIAFLLLTLAFATYHSITWFNLTPKALPLQVGEEFLPDWVIAGAHYAGWAALSFVIFALAL
jgi:fumarate reductase subunit C